MCSLNILVLHPGLKLEYFRKESWEDDWIEQAENITREEYVLNYESRLPAKANTAATASHGPSQEKDDDSYSDFGDISVGKTAHERNELEEYLTLPVEKVMDPLMWWYDNQNVYPCLSRMALDYLSAPGKSSYTVHLECSYTNHNVQLHLLLWKEHSRKVGISCHSLAIASHLHLFVHFFAWDHGVGMESY